MKSHLIPRIFSLQSFRHEADQFCFGECYESRHPGSPPSQGCTQNTMEFGNFCSLFSGAHLIEAIDRHFGDVPDHEIYLSIWPDRVKVVVAQP